MMRYICGTVRFEALGGYPERFLNEAARQETAVWDTARQGAVLTGECYAAQYRQLRPVAKKSGVRLRVKQRRGLPFLLRPFRLRWGLAVGAMLALVLLQFLSSRVWVITVSGNQALTDEEILRVIEPLGVTVGGNFEKVDIAAVQLTALQQLPALGWLTVNQSGSTVEVLVREKDSGVPKEETAPANVVAAADGIVRAITVTNGQATVKAGDAVRKGDLLISGVTDSTVGPLLRRARGTVIAETVEVITVTVPYEERVNTPTVAAVRPTLWFFGLRVPLYTSGTVGQEYTEQTDRHLLTAGEKILPIGWTVTRLTVQEERVISRTAEQAREEAHRRLTEQEKEIPFTVENRAMDEQKAADGITLTATYTVIRELGVAEPIKTD